MEMETRTTNQVLADRFQLTINQIMLLLNIYILHYVHEDDLLKTIWSPSESNNIILDLDILIDKGLATAQGDVGVLNDVITEQGVKLAKSIIQASYIDNQSTSNNG